MTPKLSLLLTLAVVLLLTLRTRAEPENTTQAPHVDLNHEFISSLKAIFANRASGDHLGTHQTDVPTDAERRSSESYPKYGDDLDSIINPPRWPELRACACTCEKDCNQPACCHARAILINITRELREIDKSLDVKPNATSISVITETDDGTPVTIYATASLDIGNNTISRHIVEKLGRESDIKSRESDEPTRREYLLLDVLLGPDHRAFRDQTFFVIEPEYNYAELGMIIGRNLLEEAGAEKLQREFTGHIVEGLEILVGHHQEL